MKNYIWIILTALVMVMIWPLGILKVERESQSLLKGVVASGPITEETIFMEAFLPTGKQLKNISVRFQIPNVEEKVGILQFKLMNQTAEVIYSEEVEIAKLKNNQFFDFTPNIKVNPRETYFFQLSASGYAENAPTIFLGSKDVMATEHLSMYYGGSEFINNAPIVNYGYKETPTKREALPYYIVTVLLFLLIVAAVPEKSHKNEKEEVSHEV